MADESPDQHDPRYLRIWEVIARIPEGRVMAYGQVARLAGLEGRARMVARALRKAPDSLELPWHRVLGAGGRISMPEGSPWAIEQRRRLEAEGVRFERGKVVQEEGPDPDDLDALVWGPE